MGEISVLILDGHADVRDLLANRLACQPDFKVVALTGDPAEATCLAESYQPDLVIIDVRRLDDVALCFGRIREGSPASRLVILTSYFERGEEEAYARLGAAACLVKDAGLARCLEDLRRLAKMCPRADD